MMRSRLYSFVVSFFVLGACSVNTQTFHPPTPLPEKFSPSGQQPLLDKWWLNFNDNKLNTLIDLALEQNPDLLASYDRLAQAKAIAKKAGAELVPSVNLESGSSRSFENASNQTTRTFDDWSLGLAAAYELDLWGRIRANTAAAELDVQASEQDIQSAAISLSAEIASAWYFLTEQRKQLELLSQQIKVNEQYADLVYVRFKGGQATAADVFQQRQLLEGVIGDRFTVRANITVLENQLSILTGQPPGSLKLQPDADFPRLLELPDTGLPSELILRRPDLRKAYYRIQAADLRVAAAIADRFPKISLSAGIGTSAPDLQSFFNNWMATLAGNLLLPVIDGNRRLAEVERNQALTAEALNLYGQRILQALKEVENALAQEKQQALRLESLKKQLQYLNAANENIGIRSAYGAFDFLRMLSTLNSLQTSQRTRIRAERELIEFRINLYRSLAGGWLSINNDPERQTAHD